MKKALATGQLHAAPISAGFGGDLRLVTHLRKRQIKKPRTINPFTNLGAAPP